MHPIDIVQLYCNKKNTLILEKDQFEILYKTNSNLAIIRNKNNTEKWFL